MSDNNQVTVRLDGKPRAVRPNGSFYSSDPSERAKQQHEDGLIGGKEYGKLGGRPRKVTAQERIAERVADDVDYFYEEAILDAFKNGSARDKREALSMALRTEQEHLNRQDKEIERRDGLDRDSIMERLVTSLLSDGPAARLLRERMASGEVVVDAEIIEDRELSAESD